MMYIKKLSTPLLLSFLFLFAFCDKKVADPCAGKNCGFGTCLPDGTCECQPGYSKDASGACTVLDPCYNKNCGNGICQPDGSCKCNPGYSLDNTGKCTVALESKFEGSYKVNETCVPSITGIPVIQNYDASIQAGANKTDSKIAIIGLCGPVSAGGFANPVNLNIVGDSIFMYNQNPDGDEFYVSGKGKINSTATRIDMNYKMTNSTGQAFTCDQVTFVKQ
jgi:hypothetical protein